MPVTVPDDRTSAPTPGRPEAARIRAMFDRVADRYDLLNHVLSMQLDRGWRRVAARRALSGRVAPRILDLCTGTGDLASELRRRSPESRVVAADFSLPMLSRVRGKGERLLSLAADALALPFPDDSFDVVTVAFGVRNLEDRARGFSEVQRVLATGGCLVVLEFTPAPRGLIGAAYRVYSRAVLPRIAALVSRNPDAYRYLPASVDEFPTAEKLADELDAAGYRDVTFERLAFGTVAVHHAVAGPRPRPSTRGDAH